MLARILFSLLLILLIAVAFVLLLYSPLKQSIQRKLRVNTVGRKLYKIAKDHDYLLVHEYGFRLDSMKTARFNHLLFGDKFFYCIVDIVYVGGLTGNVNDDSILHYKSSNENDYEIIRNPVAINQKRVEKFSLVSGLEREDLISIVVVNDDCLISDTLNPNNGYDFIVHMSELPKLIKQCESRKDIGTIEEKQIEQIVQQKILRLNENKKEHRK